MLIKKKNQFFISENKFRYIYLQTNTVNINYRTINQEISAIMILLTTIEESIDSET